MQRGRLRRLCDARPVPLFVELENWRLAASLGRYLDECVEHF